MNERPDRHDAVSNPCLPGVAGVCLDDLRQHDPVSYFSPAPKDRLLEAQAADPAYRELYDPCLSAEEQAEQLGIGGIAAMLLHPAGHSTQAARVAAGAEFDKLPGLGAKAAFVGRLAASGAEVTFGPAKDAAILLTGVAVQGLSKAWRWMNGEKSAAATTGRHSYRPRHAAWDSAPTRA